jgi:hypothetical protein
VIKLNSLIVFAVLISACGPAQEVNGAISSCRATVDAMSALTAALELPGNFQEQNPVKTGDEFDVMEYFGVLDHLTMLPGYALDYVYHYDGMGGTPILYVRPIAQLPYASESELYAAGDAPSFLDFIQTDGTPESYFQFVVLSFMGDQFYQFWHSNYNDSQIVCEKIDVNDIVASLDGNFGYRISIPSRIKAALLKNVGPTVNIGAQSVQVRLVTFTRWGGFYEETYFISESLPHAIQDVQKKNLVPYDCGVMF